MEHEYGNIIVIQATNKAHKEYGIPKVLEHAELKWVQISNLLDLKCAPANLSIVGILCLKFSFYLRILR
ncbi:hypothetical protein ABH955_004142 [Bacillus sp. RC240]|uniref:hypothetical protein n=1 Tax=Bacillus sp. RC240 TaxID=3156285 RepID=UPI003838E45F